MCTHSLANLRDQFRWLNAQVFVGIRRKNGPLRQFWLVGGASVGGTGVAGRDSLVKKSPPEGASYGLIVPLFLGAKKSPGKFPGLLSGLSYMSYRCLMFLFVTGKHFLEMRRWGSTQSTHVGMYHYE